MSEGQMLLCLTQTCHIEKCNSWSKQTTLSKSQSVLLKQISHTNHQFCATTIAGIIGRSCHKYHFCHDKSLSGQAYFCCDKHMFVWHAICHNKSMLARQHSCCDEHKHKYLLRKKLCHDQNILSRQAIFFFFFATKDMYVFVATKNLLQQKWYLRQLQPMICR